jgi:branched-chain amino acid transport system permease protein
LGIPLGRFSNYYFLLLVLIAFVILVFVRLNNSRIGRGWVAIREDEKAAEAMGVNVFGLKLFAFASGAFLAGVAGAVKAHVDISITPDQFIFLESAFLLAAVVLGGMGTVLGVLVGATLLKLLPEKLRFRQRLSADDLRPAFDHHDAVPARGHDPEPAPAAGVPRGGRGVGRAD